MSGEIPAMLLSWRGGEKWKESTRDQLQSDLLTGTGPGCRYLASNYLSTYAAGLETSVLRLYEGGDGRGCWRETGA